jgi:hypothetical protein
MTVFRANKLVDEAGAAYGVKHVNNKPRVSSMEYLKDIAEGNVPGHTPWSKMGYTPTLTTADSDVWSLAGVYTFSTSASKWEVLSSDNTQDIGTIIHSGTLSDAGGSKTTLVKAGENFLTTTAAGDCIVIDAAGTTPEWGYITSVDSDTQVTFAGGLSSGGTGASRATYAIVDASAKTGAQVIKFDYLTTLFAQKTEIIILNGTTVVDSVNTDCYRVNSFRVIATGSGAKPVGNLTLRLDGGSAASTVRSYITAGFTRARNTIYTVPAGLNLYVVQYAASYATTGNANKEFGRLYTRANLDPATRFNTGALFYPYTEIAMQNATTVIHLECPTKIPAGTDIKVSGIASAAGIATAMLRGWLETA